MTEKIIKTLALYESTGGYVIAFEPDDGCKGYVKISENVKIAFPLIPAESVITAKISVIDAEIEKIRRVSGKEIDSLTQKKQELLALEFKQ